MRRGDRRTLDDRVEDDAKRSRCDDARIDHAQAPGGSVARIRERRVPDRDSLLVDALQVAAIDHDLAPKSQGSVVRYRQRQRANRPQVLDDVFPFDPVAAGRAARESSVAIQHFDARAVELRLDAERHVGAGSKPVLDASQELAELALAVRVVERHHALDVSNGP